MNDSYKIKADILTDALPYMQDFEGKIMVIQYSCNNYASPEQEKRIMQDISLLHFLGVHPVVVHSNKSGVDIFRENKRIAALLETNNLKAIGICGIDLQTIRILIDNQYIPVVIPNDIQTESENIFVEDTAREIAVKLKADKLIFMSKDKGLFDDNGQMLPIMSLATLIEYNKYHEQKGYLNLKVQNAIKAINLTIALPFLFGSNIGTTITAVIASIGGNISAKRAAFFHVFFNIVGAIIFMLFLNPFTNLIETITAAFNISAKLQLSLAHAIFNIITTLIFYPFIPIIYKYIKKIIKSRNKEIEPDLSELDPNVIGIFPSHALAISKNKTIEMAKITALGVKETKNYFQTKNPDIKNKIFEIEDTINTLDKKITDYLILINQETLNDHQTIEYIANMKTIKDLERIGDLCINMTNYYEAIYDEKEDFSLEARIDLETMMNLVIDMLEHSIKSFENHEFDDIKYINDKESDLDYFNKKAKQRHIMRVTNKIEKSALVNSTYVDILANIERIGDHCQNIAQSYLLDEGF